LGKLFTDIDPDNAREVFRHKSRKMENKLTTVKAAVGRWVQQGNCLAIGGFGANRIPTAVGHEILQQGFKNIRFAGHTATHDFQILAAGKGIHGFVAAVLKGNEPMMRGFEKNGLTVPTRSEEHTYALAMLLSER